MVETGQTPSWPRRHRRGVILAAVALVVIAVVAGAAVSWHFSSAVLVPDHSDWPANVTVKGLSPDRIVLSGSEGTRRPGVYGLDWPTGHAIVGAVRTTPHSVPLPTHGRGVSHIVISWRGSRPYRASCCASPPAAPSVWHRQASNRDDGAVDASGPDSRRHSADAFSATPGSSRPSLAWKSPMARSTSERTAWRSASGIACSNIAIPPASSVTNRQ